MITSCPIGIRCWLLAMAYASVCLTTAPLHAQRPPITDIQFAPDGRTVIAASQLGVDEYEWPSLKHVRRIAVPMANLHSLAFSPSGRKLAVGGGHPAEDGGVAVMTWPAAEVLRTLSGHTDAVTHVAWLNDTALATASMDRSIRVWSLHAPETPRRTLTGHSRSVQALCVLPDGKTLVSAGADFSLRVWNVDSGELLRSLNQHTMPVRALALRPATGGLPMVASAAADRSIRFWQPTIGRMVRYIRLESEPLDVAWLPDGNRIAASCIDGHVRIVNADTVTLLQDLPAIDGWSYAIAAHPSGNSLVVGGTDGTLRKLDAAAPPAEQ